MSKKDKDDSKKPTSIPKIKEDDKNLDKAGKGKKTGDPVIDALKQHFDKQTKDGKKK